MEYIIDTIIKDPCKNCPNRQLPREECSCNLYKDYIGRRAGAVLLLEHFNDSYNRPEYYIPITREVIQSYLSYFKK